MKRMLLVLALMLFGMMSVSYSQSIKDIGSGAIDFLLRNPKTANRMKSDEKIALDIIGDLLKTEEKRKHELEYASAGSNQILIKSSDGQYVQFVKNERGTVFVLLDGVIYPVSQELVSLARGDNNRAFSNRTTITYDSTLL